MNTAVLIVAALFSLAATSLSIWTLIRIRRSRRMQDELARRLDALDDPLRRY